MLSMVLPSHCGSSVSVKLSLHFSFSHTLHNMNVPVVDGQDP